MQPPQDPPEAERHILLSVDRALARLENVFNDVGSLAVFALMWLTMAEVLGRRLLNSPVPGAIDHIETGMVVFAFMGAAYCQRLNGHVRMDMLVGTLRGRALWLVECLATIVAVAYISMIIYASIQDTWRSFSLGDDTIDAHVKVWPSKLVVPVSLSLLLLRLLVQLWGYVRLVILPNAEPWAVPTIKRVEDIAQEQISEALSKTASNGRFSGH